MGKLLNVDKIRMFQMKETRGIFILLYYTENATLKRIFNGACPTAQRLATSLGEPFNVSFSVAFSV